MRFGHRLSQSAAMNVLCVAEKNDAARGIAQILSHNRMQRREGRSKYNKLYCFEAQLFGRRANLVMTSVSGHLMNFRFPPQYKNWTSVPPSSLFDAPVEKAVQEQMEPIARTLKEQCRLADTLVIWTDCDREGENIGFEVIDLCRLQKPNLEVYRARFSEITPTAIHRAFNNLAEPDQRVSDAVDCRSELDLRIGASFTRLQSLYLTRTFQQLTANKVIRLRIVSVPNSWFRGRTLQSNSRLC